MKQPFRYLLETFGNGIHLIEACARFGVKRFVLSSAANLFGNAEGEPLTEAVAINPGSPYGESKHMIERALHWADQCCGLRSACLRYFNAAGAEVSEVLRAVERVGGREVPPRFAGRRAGDPAVLVAGADLVRAETGWRPRYTELDDVAHTAWVWGEAHQTVTATRRSRPLHEGGGTALGLCRDAQVPRMPISG